MRNKANLPRFGLEMRIGRKNKANLAGGLGRGFGRLGWPRKLWVEMGWQALEGALQWLGVVVRDFRRMMTGGPAGE